MAAFKRLEMKRAEEISPTELAIEWGDGHMSRYHYRALRLRCWCAACRDEMTGKELIRRENIPDDIYPTRIDPVGGYALRFHWSDGHQTGIYSYDHLRKLCECEACAKAQRGTPEHRSE